MKTALERRALLLDAILALSCGVVAWLLRLTCQQLGRIDVTVGADAPLWGLTALDIYHHLIPRVPPLFPAALALSEWLGGGLTEAGLYVPVIAGALIPVVAYAGVRLAGGARGGALLGAGLCCVFPDLVGESLIFQPESFTALSFALCAAAFLWHGARRGWGTAAVVAAAVAVAALTREHGLLLTLFGVLFLAAFPPGPAEVTALGHRWRLSVWKARALAPLLTVAVVHLAPVLLGLSTLRPMWAWTWNDKAAVPLVDVKALLTGRGSGHEFGYLRPSVVDEAGPAIDRAEGTKIFLEYGDALHETDTQLRFKRIVRLNARWARAVGRDLHSWLLIGILGAGVFLLLKRQPAMLGLMLLSSTVLPVFIIWSQRRHVTVLMPVAFMGLGLGWSALEDLLSSAPGPERRRLRSVVALVSLACALAVAGAAQVHWKAGQTAYLQFLADQARPLRAEARAGRKLRALSPPGALLGTMDNYRAPHSLLRMYSRLPLATVSPDLLTQTLSRPDLGWRTYLEVSDQLTPGERWTRVVSFDDRAVYRYLPEVTGRARACAEGVLLNRPRFLVIDMSRYRLNVGALQDCK